MVRNAKRKIIADSCKVKKYISKTPVSCMQAKQAQANNNKQLESSRPSSYQCPTIIKSFNTYFISAMIRSMDVWQSSLVVALYSNFLTCLLMLVSLPLTWTFLLPSSILPLIKFFFFFYYHQRSFSAPKSNWVFEDR